MGIRKEDEDWNAEVSVRTSAVIDYISVVTDWPADRQTCGHTDRRRGSQAETNGLTDERIDVQT